MVSPWFGMVRNVATEAGATGVKSGPATPPDPALCSVRRRHRCDQRHRLGGHRRGARAADQGAGGPQRHRRRAARRADRHLRRARCRNSRVGPYTGRRLRKLPGEAQVARRRPPPLRAAARGAAGARRPLVPLQRRQRLGRHSAQDLAARCRVRLSADLHRRAENHRQRPRRDRLLPWLWLGCALHRRFGAGMRARRCGHGRHLDQGLRLRGHGSQRRLARRLGRARGARRRTRRRTSSFSRNAPTTRPIFSPASRRSWSAWATASSWRAKGCATPTVVM